MLPDTLALLCLIHAVTPVSGLECYTCVSVYTDSDDAAAREALRAYQKDNNCDSGEPSVATKTCPEPESGNEFRCSKVAGVASGKVGMTEFSFEGTMRRCEEVALVTENKCTGTSSPAAAFGLEPSSVISVDGDLCFCNTDKCNGQITFSPVGLMYLLNAAIALRAYL